MTNRIFLVLLFTVSLIGSAFSQHISKHTSLYSWLDNNTGKVNSGLFNGLAYSEMHVMINEKHKFLGDFKFTLGSVIFNNHPYTKVFLQYDIYQDQLLARNSNSTADPIVLLDKKKVFKFTLFNRHFMNMSVDLGDDEIIDGFFEYLFKKDSGTLLKKHRKKIRNRTNDNIQYQEFEDNSYYIVSINGNYIKIKNPSKLSRQFPEYRDLINKFDLPGQKNDIKSYDSYMITVFKAITNQMEKDKTKS